MSLVPALGTPHDAMDALFFERIAALERQLSAAERDVRTLAQALCLYEGRDIHITALNHLGHSLEAL